MIFQMIFRESDRQFHYSSSPPSLPASFVFLSSRPMSSTMSNRPPVCPLAFPEQPNPRVQEAMFSMTDAAEIIVYESDVTATSHPS
jgi:hypothetical protein